MPDVNGKDPIQGVTWSDQLVYSCQNSADVHKAEAEQKGWKVTEKIASGINRLLPEGSSDVVRYLYYNLNGQQLNAEPTYGLYLIKEVRSNGTSTVRKVTK